MEADIETMMTGSGTGVTQGSVPLLPAIILEAA